MEMFVFFYDDYSSVLFIFSDSFLSSSPVSLIQSPQGKCMVLFDCSPALSPSALYFLAALLLCSSASCLSSAPLLPNKSPVKTARLQRNSIGGCGPNLLLPRPSCRPQSVFSIPLGCCSYSKLTSQQSSPCFQGLLTD